MRIISFFPGTCPWPLKNRFVLGKTYHRNNSFRHTKSFFYLMFGVDVFYSRFVCTTDSTSFFEQMINMSSWFFAYNTEMSPLSMWLCKVNLISATRHILFLTNHQWISPNNLTNIYRNVKSIKGVKWTICSIISTLLRKLLASCLRIFDAFVK